MNQKPRLGIDIDGTVTCPKHLYPTYKEILINNLSMKILQNTI